MPRAVGPVEISNRPRAIPATSPFAQHHFVGGNVFMTNLLKTNSGQLEVTAAKEQLDATFLRTLDLLMTKTAKIRVSGSRSREKGRLSLAVQVENLAGHKFPSGFPSRRAWLHITITGENGQILFESGKPGADGSIEGNDGDSSPADFEPHYQIITAAAGDRDFVGGTDKVLYEVKVGELQEKLTIRAELLFQSLSYSFMEDLAQNDTSLVNDFMGFYRGEDNIPVVVAAAELSL